MLLVSLDPNRLILCCRSPVPARLIAAISLSFALVAWGAALPSAARGQTASDFEALKQELEALRRQDAENKRKLDALERKLDAVLKKAAAGDEPPAAAPAAVAAPPPAKEPAQAALDQALEQAEEKQQTRSTDLYSRRIGGAEIRLIDISMDTLLAVGGSTASNPQIAQLEGGAHDPKKRGFTLQQAELSFMGAVDPYFTGEAHIVATVEGIELEEAFMTTTALPYDLQLEMGYFLTEFGIINPTHPHAWDWIDQPIVDTRLMGPEGLRSPGARLGWLAPVPWYAEIDVGVQNADENEFTPSFITGEPIGGRPNVDDQVNGLQDLLYLARLKNAWDLSPEWNLQLGFSGLFGPNSTGANARTFVHGTDIKLRWRPADHFRGWPFFIWQTEAMKRDYTADSYLAGSEMAGEFPNDLPGDILRDAGVYTQGLYGFSYGWAAGLRFEYVGGRGDSVSDGVLVSHNEDPFRDDRFRISPLLSWQPTEYSRFRLQYNYDNAKHLPSGEASSVWLGVEVMYGKHPAHIY